MKIILLKGGRIVRERCVRFFMGRKGFEGAEEPESEWIREIYMGFYEEEKQSVMPF